MNYYQILRPLYEREAKKMCLECRDFIGEGMTILDLGCGSGIIGREFERSFKAKLIGIDINDVRIEKIPFRLFDGKNIPFADNSFDIVLINYVLHHTDDPVSLLSEAKRVSRKRIVVYEDLPEGILSQFFCKLHGLSFNYFFQRKKGTSNFKKNKEWKKFFEEKGLKIIFEKRLNVKIEVVKKKMFVLEKI